jgi:hypothetical protein
MLYIPLHWRVPEYGALSLERVWELAFMDKWKFHAVHVHMLIYISDYAKKHVYGAIRTESFNIIQVSHRFWMVNADCNCVRNAIGNLVRFSAPYTLHHKPVVIYLTTGSNTTAAYVTWSQMVKCLSSLRSPFHYSEQNNGTCRSDQPWCMVINSYVIFTTPTSYSLHCLTQLTDRHQILSVPVHVSLVLTIHLPNLRSSCNFTQPSSCTTQKTVTEVFSRSLCRPSYLYSVLWLELAVFLFFSGNIVQLLPATNPLVAFHWINVSQPRKHINETVARYGS